MSGSHGKAEDRRRDLRRIVLAGIDTEGTLETACRGFVLAAVHDLERMPSCQECQAKIKELYRLQLDLEEISWAVDHLVKKGKLIESDQCKFLSGDCHREITERIRNANEVETAAFEHWESKLSRKFPELGTEQIAELREDLASSIFWIVREYGVETSILCDPQHERYSLYAAEVRLRIQREPAPDPLVEMIREDALMMFFENIAPVQRSYLQNLVASAYLMAVFTLDPAMTGGVRLVINGQRLYLDTNLVYSLLSLSGPQKRLFVRRILSLALHLGYQVCVSPWTLKEMENSVKFARLRLMRQRASSQGMGHLRPDNDTDERYVSAYRRAQRDQSLSLEAFFDLYKDVRHLLEEEMVDIVDDHCDEIDAEVDLVDAEITRLERIGGAQDKPRPLLEHDVKLKLLVERHRETEPRRFSNMEAMVLTHDHTLIKFAEQNEDGTGSLPFAVSLKKWATIMRRLVPRTDDFDGSLAQMHEAPELGASEFIGQKEIVTALDAIRAKEHQHPDGIVRNLINSAFVGHSEPDSSSDDDVVDADNRAAMESLGQRILELEIELRQSLVAAQRADKERAESSRRESQLEQELAVARRQVKEWRVELEFSRQDDRSSVSETTGKLASELVAVETKVIDLESRLKTNELRVRWGGGGLFAAGALGFGSLTLFVEGFSTGWLLRGALLACGAMIVGAVGWVYDRRRASVLATTIGLLLGVLASMQTLEKVGTSQPQPSVPQVKTHDKAKHSRASTHGRSSMRGHRSLN